ncbi:MAG: CDP-glucose 4,6-dehydratase [Pelagibacterales bacterium]|nr:CDP-glucose 4,6-dehydratase [Pelagibacterales bacterium]|tara:strand:- start:16966 stop:18063 length:1098 start_codon:yes stop_codon:yes gene_type:complete
MFNNIYKNKKVLITGHTGFKGSWLSSWLIKLGANVTGISDGIPTSPSMFEELNLSNKLNDLRCDIRDLDSLKKAIYDTKPDFIFHLAAQAIVSKSYSNPVDTITTNVIGTMNILESLRDYKNPCTVIMITSDKCYDNVEWIWGYKESDQMGGKDVYSGSKGAAELIIKSYVNSFFNDNHPVKISTGRAGNVIGGGDWASDRIIVDCMKAWSNGEKLEIRSPEATRPWQHVLEPLSGYLSLGEKLHNDSSLHGEAFNFGPRSEQNQTVVELIKDLSNNCDFKDKKFEITDNIKFHEASLLKLNCDKALSYLKWDSTLYYKQTIILVAKWYDKFYNSGSNNDLYKFTLDQISEYENIALNSTKNWCN